MQARWRGWLLYGAVLSALLAVVATQADTGDYANFGCDPDRCDPQPAISMLAHGDFAYALQVQPAMGPFSVILRVPGYWITERLGAGIIWEYRVGALLCLLPVFFVAIAVGQRARSLSTPFRVLLVGVFVVNPATFYALDFGHPEEALAAALVVAAALACASRRLLLGAVFLALAMLTKHWALLALVPLASLAAPGHRVKVAAVAVLVVVAGLAPLAVGDPAAFRDSLSQTRGSDSAVRIASVWWPVAQQKYSNKPGDRRRRLSASMKGIARVLIALLLLAGTVAGSWLARGRLEPVLALLALLFLLRCVLDPYDINYYHVAFVMALAAADAVSGRERPLRTLIAVAAIAAFGQLARSQDISPAVLNAVYLAWSLALAAAISYSLVGRRWRIRPRRPEIAVR